jgi:threonylcarbamoyladenosine tRNA methylthiotransferase MtaB
MKIFLDTIGCRLNQAEIESMAGQFRAAGHEIVARAEEADLAVVNTCTVTSEAASDSRAAIRRASRQGAGEVVVTGCWATLEADKARALPGVTRIVPNLQKETLTADVLGMPKEAMEPEPIARQPLPGLHKRTRAFIKAQDGCDNACTFCITTLARGASRSRTVEEVARDVDSALKGGTQEIVLTGVALGAWGLDFPVPKQIGDLVAGLLARNPIPRLRLSSLEPWDLGGDFFKLWEDAHLCRHLHLPLQSGSASVLRRMRRKTMPEEFAALVQSAREAIADVAITTDVIVGFPGETEEEFDETLAFIKAVHFAGGHVFSYSARPGTPASRMKGQVSRETVKRRSAILRRTLADSAEAYHQQFVGKTMAVLWEATSTLSNQGCQIEGLTDNYIRVTANAREPRWNRVDQVRLTRAEAEGCAGEIQEEESGTTSERSAKA